MWNQFKPSMYCLDYLEPKLSPSLIAKEILIIRESLPAYFISNVRHVQWTIPQKCNEGSIFSLFDWLCFHDETCVFFFQLDYGCYDLSLRRAWISFHLLHILLFIEPLLSAHYRHLHQQPDLRSKIDLFFQFWHKPIWEYLGKGFIVKSCKILYLQFLELHATLPLIGDGWMHLL